MQKKTAAPTKKVAAPAQKSSPVKKEAAPVEKKSSPVKKEAASSIKKDSSSVKKDDPKKNVAPKGVKGKVVEEEKKSAEVNTKKETKEPSGPSFKEINLKEIDGLAKEIFANNKIPLILDESEQYTVFLKYKGDQADFSEFNLLEKMGKKKKEDFIEDVRKQFYHSMKQGHTLALYFDKSAYDIPEFFKNVPYFIMPQILTPKELLNKEFYKKKILTPEEDKDTFGNQGYFEIREDFNVVLLFNRPRSDLGEILKTIKLPVGLFEFVVIKPNN